MTVTRPLEQTEWLGLVETAGPFLAGSVLKALFPQGLEKIETPRRQRLRAAYEEWLEVVDDKDPQLHKLHAAWIRLVLEEALEFDEEVLLSGDDLPSYSPDDHDAVYTPNHVLRSQNDDTLLFVSVYGPGTPLQQPASKEWLVSPIERMKLLCRSHDVRVGLVTNGEQWALINSPTDNTTGHTIWYARLWWQEPVTFRAFVSLLGVRRFYGPVEERIDRLLERSLSEHHEVTDTLGEQVRRAVEVLIQSLGRADEDRNGQLLADVKSADLYDAGLTVMMRLVFLLCAEERELLLLGDPIYDQHYAISTLRLKLQEDADNYGVEVLERRYDAWSRLLSTFRAVYGGIEHEALRLPAMGGSLFDPDRYTFLEGRARGTSWKEHPASPLPINNRTVMLLLRALQVLEHKGGARQLSYRGLDVEQIGHVYEGLLEYKVEQISTLTMGLVGSKKVARPTVSLQLLREMSSESTERTATKLAKITGRSKSAMTNALRQEPEATVVPQLVAACGGDENLASVILPYAALLEVDTWGTPLIYQAGSFAITLGTGRRESGSHYTPRTLTEPIVGDTLRPLLEAMGEHPTADKLLELKVCDPAMGSGAFLVEVCRQLAGHVVKAWARAEDAGLHIAVDGTAIRELGDEELLSPELPDRLVTARRVVAESCLYGVDKNPMAVELAKLSLWLVTLAKGKPFGFLDHKLKCGDSLVGLTKKQILGLSWKRDKPRQLDWLVQKLEEGLKEAFGWRNAIQDFDEFDYDEKKQVFEEFENQIADARLVGDLVVAAFFGADKDKGREELRGQYRSKVEAWLANEANRLELEKVVRELRCEEKPVAPLHWEIEFPEVFERDNPGFDAFVGNPPFLGGKKISGAFGKSMKEWLKSLHDEASGNTDIVAHFFRRGFLLLREGGTLGLVATNTIAQGDTRRGGLRWICLNGGTIFSASRRLKWPGVAAVVVSIVWIAKGTKPNFVFLDGKAVQTISAFLFHAGGHDDPPPLRDNGGLSYIGSDLQSRGFTFDDGDSTATPVARMRELVEQEPDYSARIRPYIGGEELNSHPSHCHHRFAICFDELPLSEASLWPELLAILENRVKPERERKSAELAQWPWWQFWRTRRELYEAVGTLERVLVTCRVGQHASVAFLPSGMVYAESLVVFPLATYAAFCALQSRPHELWARFFGSSMKDDLRYTPSDCFETFPFPEDWQANQTLETAGREYYEFRASLMVRNNNGLTKTYNRFHDPEDHDPDIVNLRKLHGAMDRAVLNAYGWSFPDDCEFLLDYEIDEENWSPRKRKPYRYRWPDPVHDEVLARLLNLNQKRFKEEPKTKSSRSAADSKRKGKTARDCGGDFAQRRLL